MERPVCPRVSPLSRCAQSCATALSITGSLSPATLGDFAIDDNEQLTDPALTRFVLEVRDATLPPIERRFLPNKGWKGMTTKECISLLESSGVIDAE